MSSDFNTILYEKRDFWAKIVLNRPEQRNAINKEMAKELNSALRMAGQDDDVRVVMVTGAGTAFCAGIDLKLFSRMNSLEFREFMETFYWEMTDIHYNLTKPTMAVLNGPSLAAGNSIAFSCDMVIASEKARIGYPEINVGLIAAMHLVMLPRILERHKAFELVFTGDAISATEAAHIGLINRVVPHDRLEEEAMELARKLASKSPLVTKYTKQAFYRSLDVEFRKAIADAADILCALFNSEDSKEGLRAFAEKRPPQWQGK